MTPRQIASIKKKIADIKWVLAAEKRKYGGYDDSRGLRYLPVRYFIQLGDYSGGLTYLKWFDKNFPGDSGFPEFLFEWTIILFQCGKSKEAAQKAFQTFCSNPYLFDHFFGRPITPLDIEHSSNLSTADYAAPLLYTSNQPQFANFSAWLNELLSTDDFNYRSTQYIDINKKIEATSDVDMRHHLIQQAYLLKKGHPIT